MGKLKQLLIDLEEEARQRHDKFYAVDILKARSEGLAEGIMYAVEKIKKETENDK